MIILHQNKNKVYLVYFLTLVFFVGLVLVWQRFSLDTQAASPDPAKQVTESGVETDILADIKASLELTKLQWDDLQDQALKTQQQQKLIESAQAFLSNKSSIMLTSTTQSSSTANTSINPKSIK